MPPATRRFAPTPYVQFPSRHALTLMVGYVLPCRRTIRFHRFYQTHYMLGYNRHPPLLFEFSEMKLLKNNRGTTAVEFGLLALPVIWFILGIMQTAWLVWISNLLYVSVDTAARCGAVQSTTSPCSGTDMVTAANKIFAPLTATFNTNNSCSGDGLIGTYTVNFVFVANLTFTAKSCYPVVSS
jgi:Flp pilus assembly protein TadG